MNNYAIGYAPFPPDSSISYTDWCATYGKFRWFHEDGQPRTVYPLEYEWPSIYAKAVRSVDIKFADSIIHDPTLFTNDFLALVPSAWLKYKTELEMFSGTLDGSNIDPDVFEAGFTRDTTSSGTGERTGESSGSGQFTNTSQMGERTDSQESKSRQLNYVQGVQGVAPVNTNIGEMGVEKASSMIDGVDASEAVTGAQRNQDTGNNTSTSKASNQSKGEYKEHIHETRINYYDNLAFLREREDRLKNFTPFWKYFEHLFTEVMVQRGWW